MRKKIQLGITMMLAIIIGLLGIYGIFQPIKVHQEVSYFGNKQEVVTAPNALTLDGMALRATAWRENPEYNIILGVMTAMAFVAAINTALMLTEYSKGRLK